MKKFLNLEVECVSKTENKTSNIVQFAVEPIDQQPGQPQVARKGFTYVTADGKEVQQFERGGKYRITITQD
jgi:hypothetical protein